MENEQFNIQLVNILKVVRKRFSVFIVICLVSIFTSIIYVKYNVDSYYETSTTIIVGASSSDEVKTFNVQDQRYINTYAEFFKADILAEKTIEELSLNISTDTLKERTTAIPQKDTQLIDIKLKWNNAKEAKQILETLSSVFIDQVKILYPTVNVMIIDKVQEPKEVSNKIIYVAASVLVGIAVSLLVIYVLEFIDDTVKDDDDVEKYLNLQVLSNIPKDKNIKNIINSNINIETLSNLNDSLSESYKTLRTNIEFSNIDKKVRSLIVTSSRLGDGKSISSAMLAVYMALVGRKTIWVDCDLRNPEIKNLFNIDSSLGFTSVLLGDVSLSEAVKKSEIDNLYILPTGLKPSNAAEILSLEKTKELIDMLKNDFEYVIIDSPPVGLMTDAQILSRYVDGCLLVIASGKPKIKEVIRSKRLIELVQGRVLGVVLNKYPNKIFHREFKGHFGKRLK